MEEKNEKKERKGREKEGEGGRERNGTRVASPRNILA